MENRSEGVGEQGQFAPYSRRIVDLCNEKIAGSDFSRKPPWMEVKHKDVLNKIGGNWTALPLPQQIHP